MSGSSLDGLDLAICTFEGENYTIEKGSTVAFPQELVDQLRRVTSMSAIDFLQVESRFTRFCIDAIRQMSDDDIDLIVSHGHTVYHAPKQDISCQIGSGGLMASKLGVDVLCDLRIQDIGKGRQGAPLAPVVDPLFGDYQAALNLGGIANIGYTHQEHPYGHDICPCNQLLNHIARRANLVYDKDGLLAARGTSIQNLMNQWMSVHYHAQEPASLGNHEVQQNWLSYDPSNHSVEDLSASAVSYISKIISADICKHLPSQSKVLVTGGGAHHKVLIQAIQESLDPKDIRLHLPPKDVIDYKECLLMAYMGYLYLTDQANVPSNDIKAGAYYHG